MSSYCHAEVIEVLSVRPGLQKLRVQRSDGGPGDAAMLYTDLLGSANVGDTVVLNTTAVDAGLGTGGWHIVHWNLAHTVLHVPPKGNVMKLRYTSLQVDCGAAEETMPSDTPLTDIPVIACMLLSQAAIAIAAYKVMRPDDTVALLITDQAALPLAMSDVIADLVETKRVAFTISCGQAFGGTYEAVNVRSGLGIAKHCDADAVFVSEAPGVVGTASEHGFSPFEMANVLDIALRGGAMPVLAVRYSEADKRQRHRGVSHHTETVLQHCMRAIVPVPLDSPPANWGDHAPMAVAVRDLTNVINASDLDITTMGRGYNEDPAFFHYSVAAGVAAAGLRASAVGV